jgi:uncharacterized coiled-coil protein SlyX
MVQEPTTEERLTDLEQVLIKQADRISMLEDELRALRLIVVRVARLNQPESEAA